MNLYIAGIFTANVFAGSSAYTLQLNERERAALDSVEHHLESYHYIHKEAQVNRIRASGKKVFLDSGAFSAFSLGVQVDINAYCDYCKKNEDIILVDDTGALMASVLDGIGDAQLTYEHQLHMEKQGVRPLPCYHYGEDERYLEYYIANYDYITIGGMVPISNPQLFHWLDRIWNDYLVDSAGRPKIKVHGFGLTSVPLMQRYPWFSVDSSSWVQIGAHGNLIINGKTLAVSTRSPNAKNPNQHIDTLPSIMTDAIERTLIEQGFDPERIRENTYARWAYNAWAYAEMGRASDPHKTFLRDQPELF